MGALEEALSAVPWSKNVENMCTHGNVASKVEQSNLRLAHWGRQIEVVEKDNLALPFVREMQHAGHNVAACISLALYKPAASAMRSLVECALYYTYFRTHSSELATLLADEKYYVSKKEILSFYSRHVRDFQERQSAVNLSDRLERWYSKTSAIVHGQIPGEWSSANSLQDLDHNFLVLDAAVDHFEEAVALVQDLFLCVLGAEVWSFVETDAKKFFCKGMKGHVKTALRLDAA